jgi:hypothetical protein
MHVVFNQIDDELDPYLDIGRRYCRSLKDVCHVPHPPFLRWGLPEPFTVSYFFKA